MKCSKITQIIVLFFSVVLSGCVKHGVSTTETMKYNTVLGTAEFYAQPQTNPPTNFDGKIVKRENTGYSNYEYYDYYWEDESPYSLGYRYKNYEDNYENRKGSDEPGKNGAWSTGIKFSGTPASPSTSGGSGGGSSTSCINGKWYRSTCGNSKGIIFSFGSGNRGYISTMDCNGVCSPMVFNFTYSLSGSKLTLDYDKTQPIVKCKGYADSRPNQPPKTTVSFTCNTSKLIINGVETYNR